jgi:hypothetical protein
MTQRNLCNVALCRVCASLDPTYERYEPIEVRLARLHGVGGGGSLII